MRPVPIPDDAIWAGADRRVISPPGGDLTHPDIAPVEALIDVSNHGVLRLSVCLQLEDDDLAKLTAGGNVWISFYGHMVPWAADVKGPGGVVGVDVNLYVEADPNPEVLDAAEKYFTARTHLGDPMNDGHVLLYDDSEWHHRPRVNVSTMARYYSPGYERGHWPEIYAAIGTLQAAFPGSTVFYGSDSVDDGQECTDDFLTELWEHYLGPNGDDYHQPIR